MKYAHAEMLFKAMDADAKDRVNRDFEQTWGCSAFENWKDAFAQAVSIESDGTEIDMLLTLEGTAQ